MRIRQHHYLGVVGYKERLVLIPILKGRRLDPTAQRKRSQVHLVQQNFVKQGLFEREMDIAGTRFQFDAAVRGELILV